MNFRANQSARKLSRPGKPPLGVKFVPVGLEAQSR